MTLLDDVNTSLAVAAEKAIFGAGLERSVASDDLATWLHLRELLTSDPQFHRRLEVLTTADGQPATMTEWLHERAAECLRQKGRPAAGPSFPMADTVIDTRTGRPIEQRDTTTATYGGAVPPDTLWDAWLPTIGVRRVVDSLAIDWPLKGRGVGTNLVLPRITTPTSVEVQATQNTAPTPVDPVVTDVTATEATLHTYVNVSRQAIERQAGTGEATARDLATALRRRQAAQFVAGTGAGGQITGLANQAGISTATVATTTAVAQISALLGLASTVATAAGAGLEDLVACVHPRRLAFWLASGSASREAGGATYVAGLKVVTDPAIRTNLGGGTNEDEVLVTWPPASIWIEPAPYEFAYDQVAGPQTIRVGVWSRVGLLVRLPTAVGRLSGAGLVTPTF